MTETKPVAVFSQSFSKDPKGKYGLAKNGILGHAEAGRSSYVALTPEESNDGNVALSDSEKQTKQTARTPAASLGQIVEQMVGTPCPATQQLRWPKFRLRRQLSHKISIIKQNPVHQFFIRHTTNGEIEKHANERDTKRCE